MNAPEQVNLPGTEDGEGRITIINEPPHMIARVSALAVKIVFPFVGKNDIRQYLCGVNLRPLDDGTVLRADLIAAGVIDPVAPMFMTEAILGAIQSERSKVARRCAEIADGCQFARSAAVCIRREFLEADQCSDAGKMIVREGRDFDVGMHDVPVEGGR